MRGAALYRKVGTLSCAALFLLLLGSGRPFSQADDIAAIRTTVQDLVLQEQYGEAERQAKRWLELAERSGEQSLAVADALEYFIRIYAGLKRYDDAEAVWRRCLELRVKAVGPKHALVSKTIDIMAGIYIDQGRTADAQALWRDGLNAFQRRPAVAAIERLPNPPDPTVKQVPGLIAQGRLAEAEQVLRRNGDDAGLATFFLDRRRLAEAVTVHRHLFDSAPTGERGLNIAVLYRQRGLFTYEQEFLQKAISAQERTVGSEHPELIGSLSALAASFGNTNETEKAYATLKRVVAIASKIRSKQTFTASASTAAQSRQPYLNFLRVASRLAREHPERINRLATETFEAGQLASETVLNYTLAQMGLRLSQATEHLAQLVRSRQDLEREWQRLDKLLLAAVTTGGAGGGSASEDALRSQIAAIERELATTDDQLRRNFPQYFEFTMPVPLPVSDVQLLLRNGEALIQFVLIGSQGYVWVVTKLETRWVTISQTPAEIESIVAVLRCGLDYPGAWKSSRCAQWLGRAYTEADQAVPRPLPFDLNRAHQLYQALFGQVEGMIAGKSLLVVPSGPLSTLPLHVLVTERPTQGMPNDWAGYSRAAWLARAYAVTVLPSVSSLKAFRAYPDRESAPNPYIAFANPVLAGSSGTANAAWDKRSCRPQAPVLWTASSDTVVGSPVARYFRGELANVAAVRSMPPLAETADEVCTIARTLNVSPKDVYLADRATERTVKALNGSNMLRNYRVIHFATHGLLASETEMISGGPAEPALVLTPPSIASVEDDGLLTASEISQLKLNADWVIMSACNTAAGDKESDEALSGLARAFFYAGARSLLVSHWYVNSTAAVLLITHVFAELRADASVSHAEALRRAMLELIDDDTAPGAHPAYWAPFVVVGEGRTP